MKLFQDLLPDYLKKSKKVSEEVVFGLFLNDIAIGELKFIDQLWHFQYTKMATKLRDFNPITEFPDFEKIYTSEELWPFFASRIPNLEQPKYNEMLVGKDVEQMTFAEMLKLFGKVTLTNPFVLRAT